MERGRIDFQFSHRLLVPADHLEVTCQAAPGATGGDERAVRFFHAPAYEHVKQTEKLAAGDALLFHVNQEHPKCFHSNGPFLGKLLFRRFAARHFVYVNISAL